MPPSTPNSRFRTRLTTRTGLPHLGQACSVDSPALDRSAVLATLPMNTPLVGRATILPHYHFRPRRDPQALGGRAPGQRHLDPPVCPSQEEWLRRIEAARLAVIAAPARDHRSD